MYIAVVALTMFILPTASVIFDSALHPKMSMIFLVGRWFVFWGVGTD